MTPQPQLESAGDYLYRRLADQIASAMRDGTLRVGDRIASVRRLSTQYDVSISTAMQALRHLENQRLIEARPKSGFFVCRAPRELAEPAESHPPLSPRFVVTPPLLHEYLEALKAPGVLRLGAIMPDAAKFPAERIAKLLASVVRKHPELAASYYSYVTTGAEPLRRVIARRALECGVRIGVDDIVATEGCIEALSLALRAVARPGDTIALESPTYFLMLQMIESLGMKALEIPTHPRTGVSVEALDAITQKRSAVTAVLLVPTFSNPLGSCMPEENRRKLVKLCAERDIPIIEDDVFGETAFEGVRPRPLKAWDRSGRVLWCSSFSKTVAPGLRVGWIAAGRYQKEVEVLKLSSTMFSAHIGQYALAEFVANGGYDHHLRKLRAALREQSLRLRETITSSFPTGTRITRPNGGYVMWAELPDNVDAVELFRRARSQGVVIAPGPVFTTANRYRNCIRLTISQPWTREAEDGVVRVGRIAHQLC